MTSLRIAYYTTRVNLRLWRRSWFAQSLTVCVLYSAFLSLAIWFAPDLLTGGTP